MQIEKRIFEEIRKEMEEIKSSLVEHPASSIEEYLMRVGKYQGLKESIDIVVNAVNDDV